MFNGYWKIFETLKFWIRVSKSTFYQSRREYQITRSKSSAVIIWRRPVIETDRNNYCFRPGHVIDGEYVGLRRVIPSSDVTTTSPLRRCEQASIASFYLLRYWLSDDQFFILRSALPSAHFFASIPLARWKLTELKLHYVHNCIRQVQFCA